MKRSRCSRKLKVNTTFICNREMKVIDSSRFSMETKVNATFIMQYGDENNG